MEDNTQQIIIYRMAYEDLQSWNYISNILTKFFRKEKMDLDETEKVLANRFQNREKNADIIKDIFESRKAFKPISRPENFKAHTLYDTVFYIYIDLDKIADVVDLQRLYLIKSSFEEKRILVFMEGGREDYFKISHFFEWVNEQNELFYNSVFFHNKNIATDTISRLQKKKITAFKKMFPLLEINQETDKLLRRQVKEQGQEAELINILTNKDANIELSKSDLRNSALRQIFYFKHKNKNHLFQNCNTDELAEILGNINLLTLTLFANFLEYQDEPYKNIEEIKKVINVLKRYVRGFLQLTENILFHTHGKKGIFSFRVLEGDSRYAMDKYGLQKESVFSFLEICISDYSGKNENQNIAQVFLQKLENQELRELFQGLQPVHFFQSNKEMDENIRNAWEKYYDDVEHIGKHYGLKIFRTLVGDANGRFIVESHSTHRPGGGECIGGKEKEICMPGTAYSILMPANFEEQYLNDEEIDFGIANVIFYETDLDKIEKLACRYVDSGKMRVPYADEEEKYRIVNDIEGIIKKQTAEDEEVIAVDADEIPVQNAELIYKALIRMSRSQEGKKYIAFYNCSPEFINEFWGSACALFRQTDISYALHEKELQIVLFTREDYEEMIVIPGSFNLTLQLNNQINFTRETRWKNEFLKLQPLKEEDWNFKKKDYKVLPFDIMVQLQEQGERLSIFEHYTKKIVSRSIQQDLLGCKFENTHMRLGSTIHVSQFYEAELLFGVNLFVERFAFLLALDLKRRLVDVERLTLYGFATYSEMLLYKLCGLIRETYNKIDVDYVILEREMDNGITIHIDKLRYSRYFNDKMEQRNYFAERKIVCIVPIGSTLKTNEKMINLFCEDNGEECRENILDNYEIILVGNRENVFWKINPERQICGKRNNYLRLKPKFFIRFDMEYEESLKCKLCFPKKVLDEEPLIEVNAASTVPNQAFGIQTEIRPEGFYTEKEIQKKIEELEEEMQILRDCFVYSHTKNNNRHFLFYVQTNYLMVKRHKEIVDWLRDVRKMLDIEAEVYNVIFSPSHASNVGFTECINDTVFDSSAIIIRDDIDKEYRSNFFAKYSNIYLFVKKVMEEDTGRKIRFFFADDTIVTGRSFQRAKSLVKSIVKEIFGETREEYCIFDSVFILIDRNSVDNKQIYVGNNWEKHFFAFRTIHVSSLRNHGHACVLCNLENDAEVLKKSSVSIEIYRYWEDEKIKFSPVEVEEFVESANYKDPIKRKRAYRRLLCANEAGVLLTEKCHGNKRERAMECLLQMIVFGCDRRYEQGEYIDKEEMQREFFLSYCKVLSRPFIVFNKAVKEAVFDLLLILAEEVITGKKIERIIVETDNKKYLRRKKVKPLLLKCECMLEHAFKDQGREMELLYVLLKQLTELKSNYIIRQNNINKIVHYVQKLSEEEQEKFYDRFMPQVKKLLGGSSDTSKSAWFDHLLFQKREYGSDKKGQLLLPDQVYEQLYLENNRVIFDAVTKLYQKIEFTEEEREILNKERKSITRAEYESMSVENRMNYEPVTESDEQTIKALKEKIVRELDSYLLKDYEEVLKSHAGESEWQNPSNIFPVAAQIMLYQYIDRNFAKKQNKRKAENNNREKRDRLTEQCRQIAIYLNHILRAEKTYILAEAISEADIWEENIIGRYNILVEKYGTKEQMLVDAKNKKDYLLLGDSANENRSMLFRDREFIARLNDARRRKEFRKKGYYISYEKNKESLVWKLGIEESQIYVCSELKKGKRKEEYLNDIRNAMQFSYLLNQKVFDVHNTEFFIELIGTVKDLSYSTGKKIITHTPYMVRMQQYEQAGGEISESHRKDDIIMLLADLNISYHYRDSLQKEYYTRNINFTKEPWGTKNPVFPEFPCVFEIPIGEEVKRIKVEVRNEGFEYSDRPKGLKQREEPVRQDDELICYEIANPTREIFLMLYLMITNSAVGNRSEMKNGKITVYLSRTKEGEIRITNRGNEAYNEKIERDFLDIPPYDDEGISIWTVQRYLVSFAANILSWELSKLESKDTVTKKEIVDLKEKITKLPDMVKVRTEKKYRGNKKYFSIVLPILACKYSDLW